MKKKVTMQAAMERRKYFFAVLTVTIMLLAQLIFIGQTWGESAQGPRKKLKILHIMSYHAPWKWTDDQLNGFQYALKDLDIDYKVFQMDTKRKSTAEWKETAAEKAKNLIDTWQPDLVYTNDDSAQEYVVKYYVNTNIPFVFSGVNADPEKYGFTGSKNVTGILEQEHFVESVHLLKEIVPNVKKIAVILDEGPTWPGVTSRMKKNLNKLPGVEFVSWDTIKTFKQFKNRMQALQTEADAVALLGIFTFEDEAGNNVPYTEVLKWTADNSKLPDFSFWKDRISYGTLCTVTVSGYEQGLAAGNMARGILVDGKSPSSYVMQPTTKGEPVISLARANKLGLKIKSGVLLAAEIIEDFEWEK